MRLRFVLVGVGFVVLLLLWFLLLFRPNQERIAELREQQQQTEQEIATLQALLARLESLREQEPQLRAEEARMRDALPTDPQLPSFILQVQEAASLAGIDFLSISPSLPTPVAAETEPGLEGQQLQMIAVSITTTGQYFAIEDFLVRLERLRRAVKVNSLSLAPGAVEDQPPGTSPPLSVSFSLEMYMESPAAVQPDPAAPGAETPPAEGPAEAPAPEPLSMPAGRPARGG